MLTVSLKLVSILLFISTSLFRNELFFSFCFSYCPFWFILYIICFVWVTSVSVSVFYLYFFCFFVVVSPWIHKLYRVAFLLFALGRFVGYIHISSSCCPIFIFYFLSSLFAVLFIFLIGFWICKSTEITIFLLLVTNLHFFKVCG